MKAIMISIRPEWVEKILNREKIIEIRKRFPKDYVGWVYIYCTKGKPYIKECDHFRYVGDYEIANKGYYLNGKVVARFWVDKVENISDYLDSFVPNGAIVSVPYRLEGQRELLKRSCLTHEELIDYLKESEGYAIHITKVEPFDKPKEIKEFIVCLERNHKCRQKFSDYPCKKCVSMSLLTRAPQSYYYIEV